MVYTSTSGMNKKSVHVSFFVAPTLNRCFPSPPHPLYSHHSASLNAVFLQDVYESHDTLYMVRKKGSTRSHVLQRSSIIYFFFFLSFILGP
jgi:hypothetical protein